MKGFRVRVRVKEWRANPSVLGRYDTCEFDMSKPFRQKTIQYNYKLGVPY